MLKETLIVVLATVTLVTGHRPLDAMTYDAPMTYGYGGGYGYGGRYGYGGGHGYVGGGYGGYGGRVVPRFVGKGTWGGGQALAGGVGRVGGVGGRGAKVYKLGSYGLGTRGGYAQQAPMYHPLHHPSAGMYALQNVYGPRRMGYV